MSKEDVEKILELLEKHYKRRIFLAKDSFQLLIATILSAQTADRQTEKVAKRLFEKFPNARALANAEQSEVEETIKSIGLYRIKAARVIEVAKILVEKYNGNVPDSMKELLKLPGVGRKTANVVLAKAFGKAEGIAIDTHAFRIAKRLGLSDGKNAKQVERDLMQLLPRKYWISITDMLIWHGRKLCKAQKPLCEKCFLKEYCKFYKENSRGGKNGE